MKTTAKYLGLLFALALVAVPAMADTIPPYGGGYNDTTYTFSAAGTEVTAYFYASDAAYTSRIGLSVNGGATSFSNLYNTSSYGASYTWDGLTPGDSLVFVLGITAPPAAVGTFSSDVGDNSDLKQHIYSTEFTGDLDPPIGSGTFTYIAFEDLPDGSSDWDYNDHQFVFTNVETAVPEPGILLLLGFSMGALSLLSFRWKK